MASNPKLHSAVLDIMKEVKEGTKSFQFITPEEIKAAKGIENLYAHPNPELEESLRINVDEIAKQMMIPGSRIGKSHMARLYAGQESIMKGTTGMSGAMTAASGHVAESLKLADIEKMKEAMSKLGGTTVSEVWLDEAEARIMAAKQSTPKISDEALEHLKHMAATMTKRLESMSQADRRVSLNGPTSLTVKHKAGYGKRNHIGGEEFLLDGVYVGSGRNDHRMIFVLKPIDVVDYTHAEMIQTECETKLLDWLPAVNRAVGGNYYAELDKVRSIDAAKIMEQERERLAGDYQEFGAW